MDPAIATFVRLASLRRAAETELQLARESADPDEHLLEARSIYQLIKKIEEGQA